MLSVCGVVAVANSLARVLESLSCIRVLAYAVAVVRQWVYATVGSVPTIVVRLSPITGVQPPVLHHTLLAEHHANGGPFRYREFVVFQNAHYTAFVRSPDGAAHTLRNSGGFPVAAFAAWSAVFVVPSAAVVATSRVLTIDIGREPGVTRPVVSSADSSMWSALARARRVEVLRK